MCYYIGMELRISVKIRDNRHEPVLGNGAVWLLEQVERTGSIRAAALALGMAYSKAWRIVKILERALGEPVMTRRKGGNEHGGAVLTPRGQAIVAGFAAMRDDITAYAVRTHGRAAARLVAPARSRHARR